VFRNFLLFPTVGQAQFEPTAGENARLVPGFLTFLSTADMLSSKILSVALCLGHVVHSLAQDCTTSLYSGNETVCVDPCADADVAWDRQGDRSVNAFCFARCKLHPAGG
jgi:hypothetical protein